MPRLAIAVVGAGTCSRNDAETAYDVGREIARREVVLVTGGRSGVMEAASRGAREAGGLVIGILPGLDPTEANESVDVAIPTGMGQLRNGLVVSSASAVIAVGGEWGTLSEIALARKLGKPVVGLRTWTVTDGEGKDMEIEQVDTPRWAVDRAMELIEP